MPSRGLLLMTDPEWLMAIINLDQQVRQYNMLGLVQRAAGALSFTRPPKAQRTGRPRARAPASASPPRSRPARLPAGRRIELRPVVTVRIRCVSRIPSAPTITV